MNTPEQNPFAPPQTEQAELPPPNIDIDRDMVRRFRSESLALVVFWVAMGAGCVGLANLIWPDRGGGANLYVFYSIALGLIGVALFVLGILAAFHVVRAAKAAFWLTVLLVLFPPIWFSVFGIPLTVLAILQAMRVNRWVKALKAANLPLSIRPHQVLEYRLQQQPRGPLG